MSENTRDNNNPLDLMAMRNPFKYYLTFVSCKEGTGQVESFVIVDTKHDLDTAEGILALHAVLKKERGCQIVLRNWKLLSA